MLVLSCGVLEIQLGRLECDQELEKVTLWKARVSKPADELPERLYRHRHMTWSVRWRDAIRGDVEIACGLRLMSFEDTNPLVLIPEWVHALPEERNRYRILHEYNSFYWLLEKFGTLLTIQDPDVRATLDAVKTIDEFRTDRVEGAVSPCVVQSRLSDLEYVRYLLSLWNRQYPERALSLACKHGWIVVPVWKRDVPGPLLQLSHPWRVRGYSAGGERGLPCLSPVGEVELEVENRSMFDAASWSRQFMKPLPHCIRWADRLFLVKCRKDTFVPSRGGEKMLSWGTRINAGREISGIDDRWRKGASRGYWNWGGIVKETGKTRVVVELDGFLEGENTLEAALCTLSTGEDDRSGLHTVPYEGTRVFIAVPENPFCNPPVCLVNVRVREPFGMAPSFIDKDPIKIESETGVSVGESKQGARTVWEAGISKVHPGD